MSESLKVCDVTTLCPKSNGGLGWGFICEKRDVVKKLININVTNEWIENRFKSLTVIWIKFLYTSRIDDKRDLIKLGDTLNVQYCNEVIDYGKLEQLLKNFRCVENSPF